MGRTRARMKPRDKSMRPLLDSVQSKLGTGAGKSNPLYPIVCAAIPEKLRASVVFTRLKDRCLHLVVSNGGAASRLRFCQRAILEACAVLPEAPTRVLIRVAPPGAVREAPEPTLRTSARRPQPMSTQAARGLAQAAESVDDERLGAALRRLASRAQSGEPGTD